MIINFLTNWPKLIPQMPVQQKIKLPSPHCDFKVVNHTKITKHFFPKENLICPDCIFPLYILSLFIHCILLSREILLIPKIIPQNTKSASQFFKKNMWWGKSLTTLDIFIVKWISNNNLKAGFDKNMCLLFYMWWVKP